MTPRLTQLGPLSVEDFLQNHWQKQAVFLPGALPGFRSPLTPNEIAGLALEADIESRLVVDTEQAPWQLESGPFSETRFAQLPDSNWSLLVNAVDHWVPELTELLHKFRFIANWRLDDIMVSYAPPGGSVGPHFDYYDVFLLQGAGERQWQLGQMCDSQSPLREGTDLKILRDFSPAAEYLAKPGDILYIPPGVAHWGKAASEDCVTYSIGFRAPSHADILCDFAQEVASKLDNDKRFKDRIVDSREPSGLITNATIDELRKIIVQHLDDRSIASWFGSYMTTPKYPQEDGDLQPLSDSEVVGLKQTNPWIEVNAASRFCYSEVDSNVKLFVDGHSYACSLNLASTLCNGRRWKWQKLADCAPNACDQNLLLELLATGSLLETP
ncbi:cupin domain-containing protein [Gilvimarinus sp. SDUM040013]|uniref:Cupin domain-containing protein n=1 Tax=Gilvimarinus gilvus TaxID=3058038 RepID=A0ABU4S2K8_9GAMM|nr:cupin domain-containing protein [Gilvimarinus sp. SDUM040013]MDO3388757.1 cupin domain-containing protein [Gilvimarinus sp. SDUM040013]MDX6851368.1 cupin domain-containing protein [Gilvimarinus sp. SDUM040013]